MRRYLLILIYLLIFCPKLGLANSDPIYSFAGILPIITDENKQTWVYLGVEYLNNKKHLAILAGKKEKKDHDYLDTAIRELKEESLDVFNKHIDIMKLSDNANELDYDVLFLFSTKLFILKIDDSLNSNNNNNKCDQFIQLYNERRYQRPSPYNKLHLEQRETYELRKVKLNDLIEFIANPNNFNNELTSIGGKNCDAKSDIPLRWSSKILLKNQEKLKKFL